MIIVNVRSHGMQIACLTTNEGLTMRSNVVASTSITAGDLLDVEVSSTSASGGYAVPDSSSALIYTINSLVEKIGKLIEVNDDEVKSLQIERDYWKSLAERRALEN